jgi:site-specific DNA recombinase
LDTTAGIYKVDPGPPRPAIPCQHLVQDDQHTRTSRYQHQYDLIPILEQCGVQLWLPELDGPVDFDDPTHHASLMLLGVHSRREVQRGPMPGDRGDVGPGRRVGPASGRPSTVWPSPGRREPHPNAGHARWGRRLHQLEPDPDTAGHVRWTFGRRLAGHGVASIARSLNEMGVPSPSSVDPDRNRHRSGEAWTLRTVAAILADPRYTGRQVWNRQPTTGHTSGAQGHADDVLARTDARRWSPAAEWVILLTEAERAAGTSMMICVSHSRRLVLEL